MRFPDGAEDESYNKYRVANRLMGDVSELLLVKNVTREMYTDLKEHITALPTVNSNLNVNTISKDIFLILDDNLTLSDFEKFEEEREDSTFVDVNDFVTRMQIPFVIDNLSIDTEYFRAYGQVVQGDLEYNFQSLIHRDSQGATRVVNRTLGLF